MQHYSQEAIAIFVGLALGVISHGISDGVGSALRRFRSAKGKSAVVRRKKSKS